MASRRAPYQDQLRLTSYEFPIEKKDDKNRKKKDEFGSTSLLLIVNNWHFVNDTQDVRDVRLCELSDFQVQLKLTSTAFRSAKNPDAEFAFDKQAANFPYESFMQILKNRAISSFIAEVKKLYEETEDAICDDEEVEADEEENQAIGYRKRNKALPLEENGVEEEEDDKEVAAATTTTATTATFSKAKRTKK